MYAYIPIANCQPMLEEVLDSLTENELVKGVFIHPTKAYSKDKNKRSKIIAENRLGIFKAALSVGDEYFLMCNSDLVLNGLEIDIMMDFMKSHQDFGAVGYHPSRKPGTCKQMHVGTGLMLIRTKAVENVKMEMKEKHRCDCQTLCTEFHDNGWKVDYVGYDRNAVPMKFLR